MKSSAVLLFPPNWTACVYGPHLALPLLAGGVRLLGGKCSTWDLTQEFLRSFTTSPSRATIVEACRSSDYGTLDNLYFDWEDQYIAAAGHMADARTSGLLSGFSYSHFRTVSLAEAIPLLRSSSAYTQFYRERILSRLATEKPALVGVTVASQEQLLPAVELLALIREEFPETFVLLGGNVITRLRTTSAFPVLCSLADQVALYQGDLAFRRAFHAVAELGAQKAKEVLPRTVTDEYVPYSSWAVPCFDGIALDNYVGVPAIPYVSTRGCYWGKCHFCAIPAGWSKTGYAGSAPGDFAVGQLAQMCSETGIRRVKFVDEAVAPRKADDLSRLLAQSGAGIEWEGYARLEPAWEDTGFLERAYVGGLRKLYFGLEQAPTASRVLFGKNDRGDPTRILRACGRAGIKVHLFCMVGHPGTTQDDAKTTVSFLLDNQDLVDTADLVGFRLDRGTVVPGVRPLPPASEWSMSLPYEPTTPGGLTLEQVNGLEAECQEMLWEGVPRLLHPLYRVVGPWSDVQAPTRTDSPTAEENPCLASSV
jgi:hypothetical protein